MGGGDLFRVCLEKGEGGEEGLEFNGGEDAEDGGDGEDGREGDLDPEELEVGEEISA